MTREGDRIFHAAWSRDRNRAARHAPPVAGCAAREYRSAGSPAGAPRAHPI
jgi:hypothetical protein